jgi:hypothetical protein
LNIMQATEGSSGVPDVSDVSIHHSSCQYNIGICFLRLKACQA